MPGRRHSIAVFVEPLDVQEAAGLLRASIDRTWGRSFPDVGDYGILIAAARARSTLERDEFAAGERS